MIALPKIASLAIKRPEIGILEDQVIKAQGTDKETQKTISAISSGLSKKKFSIQAGALLFEDRIWVPEGPLCASVIYDFS